MPLDRATGLGVWVATELARVTPHERWKPGDKLRLLVVGYNGKRNTGADVRTAAMVEQFRRILGDENVDVTVMSLNASASRSYFPPPTRQLQYSSIFLRPTLEAVSSHHIVVLAEGSTLKSKFTNMLTYFMCEAAGIARLQGKPCIAYGSEVGDMDPFVEATARRLCRDAYFITRSEPSLEKLGGLGLRGHLGTDTAWPICPASEDWAVQELRRRSGWEPGKRLMGVAVINPFYWPVSPSLTRTAKAFATGRWDDHYEKWFFFTSSEERRQLYRRYLQGIARAVDTFADEHGMQVVLFGMEALDRTACADLAALLRHPTVAFESQDYDGYQMTALLRQLSLLVTSRYHAKVLSMPGGVPSVAVSMDERLHNLCLETGQSRYCLAAEDPELGDKLSSALHELEENRASVREENLAAIPRYLRQMAEMGKYFRGFVARSFPGIRLADEPREWRDCLPSLAPGLEALLDRPSQKAQS